MLPRPDGTLPLLRLNRKDVPAPPRTRGALKAGHEGLDVPAGEHAEDEGRPRVAVQLGAVDDGVGLDGRDAVVVFFFCAAGASVRVGECRLGRGRAYQRDGLVAGLIARAVKHEQAERPQARCTHATEACRSSPGSPAYRSASSRPEYSRSRQWASTDCREPLETDSPPDLVRPGVHGRSCPHSPSDDAWRYLRPSTACRAQKARQRRLGEGCEGATHSSQNETVRSTCLHQGQTRGGVVLSARSDAAHAATGAVFSELSRGVEAMWGR